MPSQSFMPCRGIDNTSEDAAMVQGGREPFVYMRDVVNANITPAGKIDMIASGGKVTDSKYQCLWQSPLHKDVFGLYVNDWVKVKVDGNSWSHEVLATIGGGSVCHAVLNNQVMVAGKHGLYTYDGHLAVPLTIDAPPSPFLASAIADHTRTRSIAISWLRGDMESSLSNYVSMGESGDIALPMVTDPTVTGVNIYATSIGGTDMQLAGTVSRDATNFAITKDHKLGMAAQFAHLSPMPTGKFLCYWRGRLITATANVIRFSEPLAYHLHDERHGFIQTSQRVTFIQPVESGLWVGQSDHVIFIQGTSPDDMTVSIKSAQAPVPNSAIQIPSNDIGEAAEGGSLVTVWLASNGYVAGSSAGQIIEYQAGRISNISAQSGTTVRFDRRLVTAVN
ncbi:structural protein [Shewanella phage vB_SbaS_Y11]|nr:structural protein [Shewanella phage vB_SbaS_Y11]